MVNVTHAPAQSGCLANSMDAPPGFEPLRLLADEVMGELARAYQFIRTRADAYATELAVVASERERLERDREEVTRQREELIRQARTAGVTADAMHLPQASPQVETPKVAYQPPIEQPMPAQVAPTPAESGSSHSASPSADQFRKLRRDAKRRVKGL